MTRLDSDDDMQARIRAALKDRFAEQVVEHATLDKMGGHASLRIYWRVHLPTGSDAPDWQLRSVPRGEATLVAMVLAPGWDEAENRSAEGPDGEAPASEILPFVDVQRHLADLDIPVPAIEVVDLEEGVLLLEDLGDRSFEDLFKGVATDDSLPGVHREAAGTALYQQIIDLLVDAQGSFLAARDNPDQAVETECVCWRREFDRESLRWELDHYLEWGIGARQGDSVLEEVRADFDPHFDRLVDELMELPRIVSFRDFQSRNLMYKPRMDADSPWFVIDFQDALVAPFVYDLVALLRDSYIQLTPESVSELVGYYVEAGELAELPWCQCDDGDNAEKTVSRAFHLQTVQRKLKDAGRFVFIDREKGNPDFLPYYEPSIQYVDHALAQLEGWDELRELIQRLEQRL